MKPAVRPSARDVEERRVGEPVERDQILQGLDEAEEADELDVVEDDVDLGLARGSGLEREVVEPEADQRLARQQVEREVLQLGEDVDPHLVLAGRAPRRPARGPELGHRFSGGTLAVRAPDLSFGRPLVAERRLDAAGRQAVDELEDVLDQVGGIRELAQDLGQAEELLADQRRELRSDLLHVGGGVPQRLQRVGESGRDLRLGLPRAGRRAPSSDIVDRAGDGGLELLRGLDGLLGLLLELGRLRLRSRDEQVGLVDRVLRRLLRPLEIGDEALDPVERLRDDVGRVVQVDADRLEHVDERDQAEQLRQGVAEEVLRPELPLRRLGDVADRPLDAGEPGDLEVRLDEAPRLVAPGRGPGPN